MSTEWKISGTYFETCNCDVTCPCNFTSAPTEGDCKLLVAWHIDEGSYGDVPLNGLNVVMAAFSPGHMLETPWQVALYVDQKGNKTQQEALVNIFGGRAGGHIAALAQYIGDVRGVRSVDIMYKADGRRRSLHVAGGMASALIEGMDGQGGEDITVNNHPVAVSPGFPAVVAKSSKLSFHDFGFNWELSGKHGFYSPFAYQGP